MMALSREALGRRGEDLAAEHFASLGCRIIARNHRTRLGELDLVVRDGPEVVFVEVKTRVGGAGVAPEEAVSPAKVARLMRLAEAYIVDQRVGEAMWRIDVVAVVLDAGGRLQRLGHLRNAVY